MPSRSVADAFVNEGGRPDIVRIVPNGLDVPAIARSRSELQQALGLPSSPLPPQPSPTGFRWGE